MNVVGNINVTMVDVKSIINNMLQEIVGKCDEKSKIIKISTNTLSESGDLYFPTNLLAWKSFIEDNDINKKSRNILEHYLTRQNIDSTNYSNEDVQEKAFNLLISASKLWTLPVERASIQKERVCLFLNRSSILAVVIKLVVKNDTIYGQQSTRGESICLKINKDQESDLTTARTHQIKDACVNILRLQGYNIKEDDADYNYCLTTKSQEKINDESYQKYICGVVKNPETNLKETILTIETYMERKIGELTEVYEGRLPESLDHREVCLKEIAKAIVTFEFLSVKPSHSTFIKSNSDSIGKVTNNKGGAFVLYNVARITAILNKFEDEQLTGNYPDLWDIDRVDFEKLVLEDEWNLVYNFIIGYPEAVLNSVKRDIKHEFSTHILCSFLFHLSQKFSIYYRHCRILTQGRDRLIPTMMARLYLLKALQIVANNSLAILNITPISRM